jgi:hypothetical protein
MKSLAFLVFLFLVVPGSGQLVWDGLPLSTRAELAALVLFVVVFFSRELRATLRGLLNRIPQRGVVTWLLVGLTFIKFFTFAGSPMSAGFESCYRSLYRPLPDVNACEKSFEAPFLRARGLPSTNATRVDRAVDFGVAPYDWSLPFMNEYPRLGALWLSRFPFSAVYSARVDGVEAGRVLPVLGIGDVAVTVNRDPVVRSEDYSREFVVAVPLAAGANDLVVGYEYRDDEDDDLPSAEPAPRGPYARLKVGEPMSVATLAEVSRLRITGDLQAAGGVVGEVLVRDTTGRVVEFSDRNATQAASGAERDPLLAPFDLEIEIPAAAILDGPLTLHATTNGASTLLATITGAPDTLTPRLEPAADAPLTLTASLTADRDSLTALTPGVRDTPTPPLRALLALLDLATLAILAILAYVLVRTMRTALATALGLAGITWLAVEPLDAILPRIAGGRRELVIPHAIIATLIIPLRRHINTYPLPFLLPTATVLATQKVLEHLNNNHPGHGNNWWGKVIFFWRDSDWFANYGNARSILVESSLRGGEDIFWFRAATRYVLFAGQMLVGENYMLIGLVSVLIGFLVVIVLATRVAMVHRNTVGKAAALFVAFIGLIFVGDELIVAFGFFVSSEYPTWIAILGITAYLIDNRAARPNWATVSIAATLAALVQFRPNGAFVSVALLLVLLGTMVSGNTDPLPVARIASALGAFAVVLSLSLLHNLFYGGEFVPFTPNPNMVYVFDIPEVFRQEGIGGVLSTGWSQFAAIMYWRVSNDPNYAIFFWGCQLALVASLILRMRSGAFRRPMTIASLLPLTYVLPMLLFALESYYPRLIVAASLLCLVSALLIWPRDKQTAVRAI